MAPARTPGSTWYSSWSGSRAYVGLSPVSALRPSMRAAQRCWHSPLYRPPWEPRRGKIRWRCSGRWSDPCTCGSPSPERAGPPLLYRRCRRVDCRRWSLVSETFGRLLRRRIPPDPGVSASRRSRLMRFEICRAEYRDGGGPDHRWVGHLGNPRLVAASAGTRAGVGMGSGATGGAWEGRGRPGTAPTVTILPGPGARLRAPEPAVMYDHPYRAVPRPPC
jgi:hypothetical protein